MIINLKNILVLNCFLGLAPVNTDILAAGKVETCLRKLAEFQKDNKTPETLKQALSTIPTSVLDNGTDNTMQVNKLTGKNLYNQIAKIIEMSCMQYQKLHNTALELGQLCCHDFDTWRGVADKYKAKAIEYCDQQKLSLIDQLNQDLTQEEINAIIPTLDFNLIQAKVLLLEKHEVSEKISDLEKQPQDDNKTVHQNEELKSNKAQLENQIAQFHSNPHKYFYFPANPNPVHQYILFLKEMSICLWR